LQFQLSFKNKGHLKVTGRYLHCKCGSISETMQDGVFSTDH